MDHGQLRGQQRLMNISTATRSDRPIVLVCNPVDDDAFVRAAEAALHGGITTPAALQRHLRDRWPSAVVRPRDLANEEFDAWYVYREGRWVIGHGTRGRAS